MKSGVLVTVWTLVVIAVWVAMLTYERTAGTGSTPPSHWPSASQLTRIDGQHRLLFFAHPKCPCTRASLEELGNILRRVNGQRVSVTVIIFSPIVDKADDTWTKTDLCEKARALPNVTVVNDSDGKEAKLFGVTTSGDVRLYNRAGQLSFAGGITAERGHIGDNEGETRVRELILDQLNTTDPATHPVFGCPIFPEKR